MCTKCVVDALTHIIAERDENACRKDFTPLEKVAMGKALEAIEKPKAKERQKTHGDTAPGKRKNTSVNFTEVLEGEETAPSTLDEHSGHHRQVRDIVGAALGVSGPTYQRMKAVAVAECCLTCTRSRFAKNFVEFILSTAPIPPDEKE